MKDFRSLFLLAFAVGVTAPMIASGAEKEGYRFSSLVKGIVVSEAFRRRRVE